MSHLGSVAQLEIVEDDIGVCKEDCNKIFEPFYGIDQAILRTMGDTSLGFVILKYIAQAPMHCVSVHSNFEKGSTSIVQVPLADEVA